MSTLLRILANHSYPFTDPAGQYEEVKKLLCGLRLDLDFLHRKWLSDGGFEITGPVVIQAWEVDYEGLKFDRKEWGGIDFSVCGGLWITLCRHTLEIGSWWRYWYLAELDDPEFMTRFNRWRKVWMTIVTGLGGDRMMYVPETVLEMFDMWEIEFEEIEKIMLEQVGKPAESIFDLKSDIRNSYFIERLVPLVKDSPGS